MFLVSSSKNTSMIPLEANCQRISSPFPLLAPVTTTHLMVVESDVVDTIFFWIRKGMLGSTEHLSRFSLMQTFL